MDNAVSAQGSGAQKNDPVASPAQEGQTEANTQNVLDSEAVQKVIEERVRNAVNAEMRRMREASAKPKPQQTEEERTLTQRIKELEEDKRQVAEERKVNSIRSAAVKAGVPEDRVDVFVDHVLAQKGSQIVADKQGALWDQYGDPESRKPISELIGEVLKAKGEVFKPTAPLPQARGVRANGRGAPPKRYDEIPLNERLKMSKTDREQLFKDSIGSLGLQ